MPNKKISILPIVNTPSGNDILPLVNGGVTKKITLSQLGVFLGSSGSTGGTGTPLITLTKAALDIAVSSSTLTPGQQYKITGVDTGLYGGTDILIKAASVNVLELAGSGIFYNPKYDQTKVGYGIWTTNMEGTFGQTTTGYSAGNQVTADNGATAIFLAPNFLSYVSGNWSGATSLVGVGSSGQTVTITTISGFTSPSYAIGDKVIWGGKLWVNVAGNIGAATDMYTLNSEWVVVPFDTVNYNVEIDTIEYDYAHNAIIRRKDSSNNEVICTWLYISDNLSHNRGGGGSNPIKDFQWGNIQTSFNQNGNEIGIKGNFIKDSYMNILNTTSQSMWYNTLTNGSTIGNNNLDSNSYISYNTLNSSMIEDNNLNSSSIDTNILNDFSGIKSIVISDGKIYSNQLDSSTFNIMVIFGGGVNNSYFSNSQFSFTDIIQGIYLQNINCYDISTPIGIENVSLLTGNQTKTIQLAESNFTILTYYNSALTLVLVDLTHAS
jgi:hypothetical protein